ncbi:hypothetical protein DRE_06331 [Drechslerella stenobrocha 248]|uniref:U3 small nucleolar RNA-associated protein 22 n=1 Tax=Drechslerella stenobrocha 248 TaxID=1043628 RepID=W7HM35_9PEZI|nr:hypothetical protein DRE_06331 [Drechslerella stenobrocha 248]
MALPAIPDHLGGSRRVVRDFINHQRHNRKAVRMAIELAESVKSALSAAESLSFSSLREATSALQGRGISLPFETEHVAFLEDQNITLLPPRDIEIGAGLNHGFLPRVKNEAHSVDLIIGIPSSIFHPKDYLEFRYFWKRALYLTYIASLLMDQPVGGSCRFSPQDGDELRPVLLMGYSSGIMLQVNCVIRIIPAISPDLFPVNKISPTTCWACRSIGAATPQYNASILADVNHFTNAEKQKSLTLAHKGFEGGLVLGNAWLRQGNYSSHLLDGGFGAHEWALLQSYLIESDITSKTSQSTSDPFELFKSVLRFIANIDSSTMATSEAGYPFCLPSYILSNTAYAALFKMSRWSYLALKHDATTALSLAQPEATIDSQFRNIFADTSSQGHRDVDLIASFPIKFESVSSKLSENWMAQWNVESTTLNYCHDIFFKGLSNRYKKMTLLITKHPPGDVFYQLHTNNRKIGGLYEVSVFVTLDEHTSKCDTDYGPALDDPEGGARFRDFWQEKSELRKFKDGRILETVRWEKHPSPVEQIFTFLYQKIAGPLQGKAFIRIHGPEFERLLDSGHGGGSTNLFDAAINEFSSITAMMHQIKDFPLSFRGIRTISPELCSTSVMPPLARLSYIGRPGYKPEKNNHSGLPLEAEIEFEGSSSWPIDPEQQRRSEFGLLVKLGDELRKNGSIAWVQVGMENFGGHHSRKETRGFLDILTLSHYYFKFRLKRLRASAEVVTAPSSGKIGDAWHGFISSHDSERPHRHRDMVARKSNQHPYLRPVIRLVKKWFQSHLLASFFNEEILELFGVVGFKSCSPHTIPGSAFRGFERSIGELSQWDWRKRPLQIEISRSFADDERANILTDFESRCLNSAKSDEVTLLVVVASAVGTIDWVNLSVPCLVATRMTQLAKEARILLPDPLAFANKLFVPNLKIFNFVLVLLPSATPGSLCQYTNYSVSRRNAIDATLYTLFYEELQGKMFSCFLRLVIEYLGVFGSRHKHTAKGQSRAKNQSSTGQGYTKASNK